MDYLKGFALFIFVQGIVADPLEAGQPGLPWTEEEIDIVRDKLVRMMECSNEAAPDQWTPHEPTCWLRDDLPDKLNEGSLDDFTHDLDNYGPHKSSSDTWNRYEDGSGGCDGCINWAGMGWMSESMEIKKNDPRWGATPTQFHTTNNKLQMTVRTLELIYTVRDWPTGARVLPRSLKDLGKSRADLWQFAGNFGLERAIQATNDNGKNSTLELNSEAMLCAIEGEQNCMMTLDRPLPFRTGRVDCIPDENAKWTPYAFEATKKENHANPHGTGIKVIQDLNRDFGLTARESIALFAVHGLSSMGRNHEESLKYKWIGGMSDSQRKDTTTFSNMYHKILNGKTYDRGNAELYGDMKGYYVGDANGNPVGKSAFSVGCGKRWTTPGRKAGGPCHFRPLNVGSWETDSVDEHRLRDYCFDQQADGSFTRRGTAGCESAELFEQNGFTIQRGGPQIPPWKKLSTGWQFMLPYEAGLVVDFQVDPTYNVPYGCGAVNGSWVETRIKPVPTVAIYPGSPAYESNPGCQFVTYAPEGEALPDIVEKFADDHDDWQKTFFNAWEKMQMNGYDQADLTISPENGNLLGVTGPVGETMSNVPCEDKRPSAWCNPHRCGSRWWWAKTQCMATCGICQAGSMVPCKDFKDSNFDWAAESDSDLDCANLKADGMCEAEGKRGEIAKLKCFKTCNLC